MKQLLLVMLIVFMATIMRLYQFGSIPQGLNRDEASIGYTAYSLLMTGKEEHGVSWPLKFESFGDWKQPVYIYLLLPLVKAFGLSEITVRLPSLLAGLVMIISVFMLTQKISGSKLAGYIASIFLTLNPWHFHFSHLGLEAMIAATLVSLAVLLSLNRKNSSNIFGIILLILALYTYHAAFVYVPLLLAVIIFVNRNKILRSNSYLISILLLLSLIGFLGYQGFTSNEKDKVTGTTIFYLSSEELWKNIYQYRNGGIVSKLIHNQYFFYTQTFLNNYASAFSKEFLINRGGIHPHYNIPGFGNFIPIEILLSAVGIVWVFKKKQIKAILIISALLLAPIPGAITKDGVHSTRNIFMLPYVQVFAGIGFHFIYKTVRGRITKLAFSIIVTFLALFYAAKFYSYYFNQYAVVSDTLFSGYMKPISKYIYANQDRYQNIFITYPYESPYIFYAFYNQVNPTYLQTNIEYDSPDSYGFRHVNRIGNIIFISSVDNLRGMKTERSLVFARSAEIVNLKSKIFWTSMDGEMQVTAYENSQTTSTFK